MGSSAGAFALEPVIADGGFGTVYRAAGGPRGTAAVKVLHAEVEALGRVRHPGLAEIHADDADLAGARADADAVWNAARAHFSSRGFVPALEASESILFVRPLAAGSGPPPDPIAEMKQLILVRSSRHPSVNVTIAARSGEAAFAGSSPVGGPLLDLASRMQRSPS